MDPLKQMATNEHAWPIYLMYQYWKKLQMSSLLKLIVRIEFNLAGIVTVDPLQKKLNIFELSKNMVTPRRGGRGGGGGGGFTTNHTPL